MKVTSHKISNEETQVLVRVEQDGAQFGIEMILDEDEGTWFLVIGRREIHFDDYGNEWGWYIVHDKEGFETQEAAWQDAKKYMTSIEKEGNSAESE